jgi:transcriptional regulator with XRE-family HTH domain
MLKEFRTSRKIKLREMSNIVGVPISTYESWENKRRKPGKKKAAKLKLAIDMIKLHEKATCRYKALEGQEIKPSFFTKLKNNKLKLISFILIVFILTVIW